MAEWVPYVVIGCIIFFLIISIATSRSRIRRIYRRYMNMPNSVDLTGKEYAFILKKHLKLEDLNFALSHGELTDAYNSKTKTLILSEGVCNTASIASIAIVSHEIGHAVQDKKKSTLLFLTGIFRRVARLTNKLVIPLLLVSLLCFLTPELDPEIALSFLYVGAIFFILHIFNLLLNIPLELNASQIALKFLKKNKILKESEYERVKYLLKVALQTYIASFFDEIVFFGFKRRNWW